jgi:hypothetical protein
VPPRDPYMREKFTKCKSAATGRSGVACIVPRSAAAARQPFRLQPATRAQAAVITPPARLEATARPSTSRTEGVSRLLNEAPVRWRQPSAGIVPHAVHELSESYNPAQGHLARQSYAEAPLDFIA